MQSNTHAHAHTHSCTYVHTHTHTDTYSRIVIIIILVPGEILSSPPSVVRASAGSRIQFDCFVAGRPLPTVLWIEGGSLVSERNDSSVADLGNGSLVIDPVEEGHQSTYYCAIQGKCDDLDVENFEFNVVKDEATPTSSGE